MTWVTPDSQGMLAATAGLPEQLEVSTTAAADVPNLPSASGLGATRDS